MPRPAPSRSLCRHAGYTLLEMLLVLAVLLAVFGIAYPVMQRVLGDFQLKQAVENVRVKLAGTRIHAIDSGLTYQFRYEPGGRRFLVIPFEPDTDATGRSDQNRSAATADVVLYVDSGQLAEELTFEATDPEEPVEQIAADWLSDLPDRFQLAQASWSPPLLFYSDGSATDAEFRVIDAKGQYMRMSVRGLTGSVGVRRVQRESR